jgi:hypothetical protein
MRGNSYSFSQDINGNFVCKILMFQIALLKLITLGFISAFLPLFNNDHEIYINGMFNNYSLTWIQNGL